MNTPFDGGIAPPRNGQQLQVLIVARISTVHQDRRSLEDQRALCVKYLSERYTHPFSYRLIQGQGSGEYLDRKDLLDAEEAVATEKYDLVIVEDIGRICRRNRAIDFCEACEDAKTRLISINDSIDTSREDWRLNAFFASFKHESGNKDTAMRIRRSTRNRFTQGTIIKTFPYGYVKPPGAKSDADIYKDPAAIPVMEHVVEMLEGDASYEEVADWLHANNVPTSPWTKRKMWYGGLVKELIFNPILKGVRRWNARISRRINKTGRRKYEVASPQENLFRDTPHLAFVEAARYDRLILKLKRREENHRIGRSAKREDGRQGAAPKKRTVWPGQHLVCGVCGRNLVWGGFGPPDDMICSGLRDFRCWNAYSLNGREAGRKLLAAFWQNLEGLPEFSRELVEAVRASVRDRRSSRTDRLRTLGERIDQVKRQLDNVAAAIADVGNNATLKAKLFEFESTQQQLEADREGVLLETDSDVELPSPEGLRGRAREALGTLDFGDPAFGRLIRKLMPTVRVFPVRSLDGGDIYQRAFVEVLLTPLVGPGAGEVDSVLRRQMTVDLFKYPQRVEHLPAIMRRIAEGATHRQIGGDLGIDQAAVQRARTIHRMMLEKGTNDPFTLVQAPPTGTKMKRTVHPRYEFRPLPGFPAWPV